MDNPELYFRSKLINPYNDDKGLIETSKEFIQDLLDYGMEVTKVSVIKGPPQSSVTVYCLRLCRSKHLRLFDPGQFLPVSYTLFRGRHRRVGYCPRRWKGGSCRRS